MKQNNNIDSDGIVKYMQKVWLSCKTIEQKKIAEDWIDKTIKNFPLEQQDHMITWLHIMNDVESIQ